MHKRVTFRNMDHSMPMEEHVTKQLAKIEKFLENEPTPIYIDMILEAANHREHPRAELRIKTPHYDEVTHYEHNGVDMYDAIDKTIDKMYAQLRKARERSLDERKQRGRDEEFKKQR